MHQLLTYISRNPFLAILISVAIATLIGYNELPLWSVLIPMILGIAIYLLLHFKSKKSPLASYRFRNWHWTWIICFAFGIGLTTSIHSFPKKLQDNVINDGKIGIAYVNSIVNNASGDRLIITVDTIVGRENIIYPITPLKVKVISDATMLEVGDWIALPLSLKEITDNNNHQNYDYRKIMLQQGVCYQQYTPSDNIALRGHTHDAISASNRIRNHLISIVENTSLSLDTQRFVITAVLGNSNYLTPETRESFSEAGIAHVLALSGLHIAIIAMIFNLLFRPIDLLNGRRVRLVLVIISVWIFTFISGLSPSAIRASIMTTFVLTAMLLQRKNSSINALCAAATLILIVTPNAIFNIGFQLSIVTVATILIYGDKLNFIDRVHHPIIYQLVSNVMISIIAVVGSWSISAYYFHSIPIMFLPVNVIVLLILPIYISLTMLHILLCSMGWDLTIIAYTLNIGYDFILYIADILSLGGTTFDDIWLSPISVFLYLATIIIIALYLSNRQKFSIIYPIALLAITTISFMFTPTDIPRDGFIIQNRWDSNLIRIYYNGKEDILRLKPYTTSSFCLYEQDIIYIDENTISRLERRRDRIYSMTDYDTISHPLPHQSECDYIIIGRNYRGTIRHVTRHFSAQKIVLMPEIYDAKEHSLISEGESLKLVIHSIQHEGPLSFFVE